MSMSIHDALDAWQSGSITARRAMTLTGASDVLELYGLAEACGVETRFELSAKEKAAVERVGHAIDRELAAEDDAPRMMGMA